MPGVWNVNNGYNVNSKKISSKLTFEVGERFTGRVVSKGDGKDVTIKLADGWQFIAELDDNVNLDDIKLVKFQVDGFDNGKLKLKLVKGTTDGTVVEDENFKEIIEKEGLSKDDIEVLKRMVKHNIPLTRENINEIKSLIQFNEKINSNSGEIDAFIEKYLQSKGIESGSEQGDAIKETLTKFLSVFKNMDVDDIITFIENKLDFSEENIDSYNKLFKEDSSIEKLLVKIRDSLNNLDMLDEKDIKTNQGTTKEKLVSKDVELTKPSENNSNVLASKVYNSNEPTNRKLNILDILKTISGNTESKTDISEKAFSDVIEEKGNISDSLMEKLEDKQLLNTLKSIIGDSSETRDIGRNQASSLMESFNKSRLEDILTQLEGREVSLTDSEYKKFNEWINSKLPSQESLKQTVYDEKSNLNKSISTKESIVRNSSEEFLKNILSSKDEIKSEMKDKIDNIRDIVRGIISKTELKDVGYDKVMGLIKENINTFKVFNSISNEYYYLNIPINVENKEYPCKFIIKDNRKDGKKIDKTNAKMVVSVKTINLGEVDGYLTMKENRIDVMLKCEKEFISIVNNNKVKLVDGLGSLGLFVNVNVAEKENPVDIVSCRDFFNDFTISTIDIKV